MTGILVIIYSLDASQVHYNFVNPTRKEKELQAVVPGLPDDGYYVSVFIVEESGKPFSRAASTPRSVQVNGSSEL